MTSKFRCLNKKRDVVGRYVGVIAGQSEESSLACGHGGIQIEISLGSANFPVVSGHT
jgi:hypothetical protein